jgi:hypothetical protein
MVIIPIRDIRSIDNSPKPVRQLVQSTISRIPVGGWAMVAEEDSYKRPSKKPVKRTYFPMNEEMTYSKPK